MKRKIIISGPEANRRVVAGAHYAAAAVARTFGPHGRNFASGIVGGPIHISNDGVSLLKQMEGRDEVEDIGVRAVQEAAVRVVNEVGDGTSLVAILTSAILRALPLADEGTFVSKMRPTEMIAQVKRETEEVIERLGAMKREIENEEDLIRIVEVSAEDPKLAALIGRAQWTVGRHGSVVVEESNAVDDKVEYIHGIKIDNGFTSSRFITNQEKQALDLKDARIILTNHVFHGNFLELKHIFEGIEKHGDKRDLVILAGGFDDGAIATCLKNIEAGGLRVFPVNAPYLMRDEIMEDLAAVTGARYIETGARNLETMLYQDIGGASKVFYRHLEGVVTGHPSGHSARVDEGVALRIAKIEERLGGELSPFERERYAVRLAQLRTGTAVIKVGAETEQERSRKKDKIDDAVHAARAALQEGVVPGAGQALHTIAESLPEHYLIRAALMEPRKLIAAHAPDDFVVEEWVQDPYKVLRIALRKAADIASSLATTEIAINLERDKPQYVTTVDNKIGESSDE